MSKDQQLDREMDPLDELAFREARAMMARLPVATSAAPHKAPPAKVNLGKHLRYIRCQGGSGCFAYATLAAWDIMNEMACPYSPNMAIAPWMFFHRRRDAWQGDLKGIVTRDGRFISLDIEKDPVRNGPEYGFFQVFGNPTEGTEMAGYSVMPWCGTSTVEAGPISFEKRPNIGWTVEGMNEAHNYRLDGLPQKIEPINSQTLMEKLASGYPIRVSIPGHVVALVGYDLAAQTFTYVDSSGDNQHNNGFATYSFGQVDDPKKPLFDAALIFKIRKPLPVPAVRISFTHTNRMNVSLWLSVEGSPMPKRQIWPPPQFHDDAAESYHTGRWFPWDDNSRNLSFTVRAPTELMWPPGPDSRLILDLYDAAPVTETGGALVEFAAAFGGHVMTCAALAGGPAPFNPYTHQRFFIG